MMLQDTSQHCTEAGELKRSSLTCLAHAAPLMCHPGLLLQLCAEARTWQGPAERMPQCAAAAASEHAPSTCGEQACCSRPVHATAWQSPCKIIRTEHGALGIPSCFDVDVENGILDWQAAFYVSEWRRVLAANHPRRCVRCVWIALCSVVPGAGWC